MAGAQQLLRGSPLGVPANICFPPPRGATFLYRRRPLSFGIPSASLHRPARHLEMASDGASPSPSASAKKRHIASADPPTEPAAKVAPVGDQIWTPEKTRSQLLRRGRNRSVAFSVKEVRRVAMGLQRGSDRPGLAQSCADLAKVEEQLVASSVFCSRSKALKAKPPVKLPEKYERLYEFFNCMESSIRLLRLKGAMSTFANVCTSIEHLTDRRFTYAHLAQLKYIMPEAIMIKKVFAHDEVTCCMKPELQINLQVDAVAKIIDGKSEPGYSILRAVFRERLVGFFKDHPEGDDVPEEQLPHPFNQTKPSTPFNASLKTNAPGSESPSVTDGQKQIAVASHMSQSFKRRFSRRLSDPNSEKNPPSCLNDASSGNKVSLPIVPSPARCTSKPPLYKKSMLGSPVTSALSSKCGIVGETAELPTSDSCTQKELSVQTGTPAKEVSTPSRLMVGTPDIPSSKRCRTTPSCDSPLWNKSTRRSARTKLFMTPKKGEIAGDAECENESFSAKDDVLSILPKSLIQSVREKEQKLVQEKEAGVADAIRRQKLIATLPSVFDMILLTFQSLNRSVMTKQELIQKLISSHCKIVDRAEVEKQLILLLELVPDWISEKIATSGDILCCVNKLSIPEEIRRRLSEAE